MEANSEKETPNREFLWVQHCEAASLEFARNLYAVAATQWEKAYRIAQDFGDSDPRVASSLNNLAIAHRIKGNFEEAERLYRCAIEGWKASSHWIDSMCLSPRARSSLFHFRLEQKHRKQYDQIARSKYQKLLHAGQAGTRNNLGELFQTLGRLQDAEKLYNQALQERIKSMGMDERGVETIRRNVAALSDVITPRADHTVNSTQKSCGDESFNSQALRQGWIVDDPPEFTDEGRLMAAILLTCLIDHSRLSMADG
ncbi:MAG: tetratricopeptide repeat protein [Proteobacteria bacterium]|nr:tetratricopeptide repeat protein [Pseudomonadota bacterium]